MAYATKSDLVGYADETSFGDDDAIDRLLDRASQDIDHFAGFWSVEDDGWKFGGDLPDTNLKDLSDAQVEALRKATCAQAEYRFNMTESFFVEDQRSTVSGPDFVEEGKLARLGPKAKQALVGTGLLRHTGKLR